MSIQTAYRLVAKVSGKVPLRTVLIVPFVLQIFAAVGLVGYLSFRNGQKAVNDVATQLRREISDRIQENLHTYLATPHQINQSNAAAIRLRQMNMQDLASWESYFLEQIKIFNSVNSIVLGNEDKGFVGVEVRQDPPLVIMRSDKSTGYTLETYAVNSKGDSANTLRIQRISTKPNYDPRIRPWYTAPVQAKQPTWSAIFPQFETKNLNLAAVRPVYDQQGNLGGVLNSSLHLLQVGEFLSKLNIGKTGQSFIIERDGMLVATSTPEQLIRLNNKKFERLKSTNSSNFLTQATAKYLHKNFGGLSKITTMQTLDFTIDGKRQFLQVLPFRDKFGLDWLIVVVVPEADFMEQINANTRTTILLCIAALIVAMVVGIFTARWVVEPILCLNISAQALSRGKWEQTVEFERSDELGQLAKSFNSMARQLQESFAALEANNAQMKALNQALSESESRLAHFLDAMPVGVFVADANGQPYYVNQTGRQILGQGLVESATIERLQEVYQVYLAGSEQQYPSDRDPIVKALQGESVRVDDIEIRQPDKIIPIESSGTPIYDDSGNLAYAIAAFTDITKRKQTEKLLAEYNRTLEAQVKERTQELSQALEHLKATQQELIQSEKMAALGQLIAGIAHEINTPLGAIQASIGNVTTALDKSIRQLPQLFQQLSSQQQTDFFALLEAAQQNQEALSSREERQLKRALTKELEIQKIEDANIIAANLVEMGITQNIAPFIPILQSTNSALILEAAYNLSVQKTSSQTIMLAIERVSKIVFALKSYARQNHSGQMSKAQVTTGIDLVLTLYHNHLKQGIEVIKNYGDVPAILCYPEELNQVWTNLIHNAIQAMNHKGKLEIAVSEQDNYVVVQVTDSGCGIPPEIKSKIFEPFFTTKPPGEGSGLGLDIVRKIIDKHQGKIEAESESGRTTFSVWLPSRW